MDVLEAIRSRRTIRAFKPEPVPKEILRQVLEVACLSPSWANTQPWEFAILGGKVMEEVKEALYQEIMADVPPSPDIPRPEFPEEYQRRSAENMARMLASMGIDREDQARRREFRGYMARFFGAPNAIIFFMDASLGLWSILDTGMVMQTVMLAARAYGLGTATLFNAVRNPDMLRRVLKLPQSKKILCGMAIGYPDEEAPQNRFERPREPLEKLATWPRPTDSISPAASPLSFTEPGGDDLGHDEETEGSVQGPL